MRWLKISRGAYQPCFEHSYPDVGVSLSCVAVLAFVSSLHSSLANLATAQTAVEAAKVAAEIDRVASNLPLESRTVITRLTMLRELPGGVWKTHSGDVAHGEDVNLDESGWQTQAVPGNASNDAVWFRQTYTVPGDAERVRPDRLSHLVSVSCRCQRADAGDSLLQWAARCARRRSRARGPV